MKKVLCYNTFSKIIYLDFNNGLSILICFILHTSFTEFTGTVLINFKQIKKVLLKMLKIAVKQFFLYVSSFYGIML